MKTIFEEKFLKQFGILPERDFVKWYTYWKLNQISTDILKDLGEQRKKKYE
jgi:hypothetical protein